MRVFQIRSERSLLAEIRFHGETTDAAGEAHIVQGTEATLEAILDILGQALVQSRAMTYAERHKKNSAFSSAESSTPSNEAGTPPAATPSASSEVVTDLSAFRAKKGVRRNS